LASIIPLAIAAAVYPTLLAGVILLLGRDNPAPLLGGFLAGGVLISLTTGLIIVFALGGAVSMKSQNSASPTIDLIAGILSIVLAGFLWKREHDERASPREAPEKKKKDGPSWTQRTLGEGSGWAAFGAGLILNLPGIWYLDGLKEIAKSTAGTATQILWILLFIAIMFALAELPLIGYAVNPDGTRVRVHEFQEWLSKHARTVAMWAAAAIGTYLTVKGIVGLT
jgi:Sap, sulfolipid-1-addressing protein